MNTQMYYKKIWLNSLLTLEPEGLTMIQNLEGTKY